MVAEVGANFVKNEVGSQKSRRHNGEDHPESPEAESYVVHLAFPNIWFKRLRVKPV